MIAEYIVSFIYTTGHTHCKTFAIQYFVFALTMYQEMILIHLVCIASSANEIQTSEVVSNNAGSSGHVDYTVCGCFVKYNQP